MNTNFEIKIDKALQEKIDSGSQDFKVGGVFGVQHLRNGDVIHEQVSPNIVVNEGLNYILDSALSGATVAPTHYIGIFKNNYTPQATDVMATFAGSGVAGEATTEIDNGSRPTWTEAGVTDKVITNSASPAVFTANTTVAIYGAFLSSNATKGGTAGRLIAASKFASVRNLEASDVLNVTYTLTIADA